MIRNIKYQIVTIGCENDHKSRILDTLFLRIEELGLNARCFEVLDEGNFHKNYKSNCPTVTIYFGGHTSVFPSLKIVNELMRDVCYILPVVKDLNAFTKMMPKILHSINGKQLSEENDIEGIVNNLLEGLSLLRASRRLFISYKRSESTGVAIQLFEKLEKSGFDVFLDTHSVHAGDVFQDELWHRLADTDVVVLLNSKGFLNSQWTKQELARASAMSIGIVQLVWPDHEPEDISQLTEIILLSESDFIANLYKTNNCSLQLPVLSTMVTFVESLRARTLRARQDNLITEFIKTATASGIVASLQPERFITIEKGADEEIVVLPTVGVPHAFRYNQSEDLIKQLRASKKTHLYLLYDQLSIRNNWIKHLEWLDSYLPIKSVKVTEVEAWLRKI